MADEPDYVTQDMQVVADAMTTAGFSGNEKYFYTPSDGQHSEWFWAREFPDAYVWLFQGAVTSVKWPKPGDEPLDIFPNPTSTWVRFSGVKTGDKIEFQILGTDGKMWRNGTATGGDPIWTGDLPAGFYVFKVKKKNGKWYSAKLVRQ